MAQIKLSYFSNFTKVKYNPTTNSYKAYYENIDRAFISNQAGGNGGAWFSAELIQLPPDLYIDNCAKKCPLIPLNFIYIIYCSTILGELNQLAKLCGAPEPPFIGNENDGQDLNIQMI